MDTDMLRERIARAVDPGTWSGIDRMEAMGREAPYLRITSRNSLAAADRVIEELAKFGLETLAEEVLARAGIAPQTTGAKQ